MQDYELIELLDGLTEKYSNQFEKLEAGSIEEHRLAESIKNLVDARNGVVKTLETAKAAAEDRDAENLRHEKDIEFKKAQNLEDRKAEDARHAAELKTKKEIADDDRIAEDGRFTAELEMKKSIAEEDRKTEEWKVNAELKTREAISKLDRDSEEIKFNSEILARKQIAQEDRKLEALKAKLDDEHAFEDRVFKHLTEIGVAILGGVVKLVIGAAVIQASDRQLEQMTEYEKTGSYITRSSKTLSKLDISKFINI